jgi:hypothetical protein
MGKRTPISENTIAAVATELAGHPLPNDRLPVYAAVMEQINARPGDAPNPPAEGYRTRSDLCSLRDAPG